MADDRDSQTVLNPTNAAHEEFYQQLVALLRQHADAACLRTERFGSVQEWLT